MDPVHNDQTALNSSSPPFENTPIIPPPSDTSQVNELISGDGRIPSKRPWTKVPILKVVTLGVLVIGLFFGLRQAQTNQDIQKSKASYCGLCSPNGDCECANGTQTGNKCKYAPPECSNLGNTWQPDSGCTANAACGTGGGGGGDEEPISTPTSIPTTDTSCRGKNPTTSCSDCGGNHQGYCGVGDNSTTCNCNSANNPCDPGFARSQNGQCVYENSRPGPSTPPKPTDGASRKEYPPSPTSANEKPGPPKPKPTNR